MLAILLACLLQPASISSTKLTNWHTEPAAAPFAAAVTTDEKALKALAAWLKHYRSGKMELRPKGGWQPVALDHKDSFAVKFGLAPKTGLGNPTWAGDLETILEQVAKLDSPEAAQALLEVASTGIDPGEYTREMAPYEVRGAGEKWLRRLVSQPARDEVLKGARGELKVDKSRQVAVQVAAMRWLGSAQEAGGRAVLEQQLAAADPLLRVTAAEMLGSIGDDAAAPALVAALERDPSDLVLPAIAQALRKLFAKHQPKPAGLMTPTQDAANQTPPPAPPAELLQATQAAYKALGRATWRTDLALLDLLDDFRNKEAIPALVGILERFRDNPQDVRSGKLSGLLLHRTHELLVAMTGAIHGPNQADKWREFWDREKDKLEVNHKRQPNAAAMTSTGDFCGIPVQGTRVLFILDLSGSMNFPMQGEGAANAKGGTRLEFAKRELGRALDAMAANAWFNLITFNGNPKPKVWNKDMMLATDKNRDRFRKYVQELNADGGTNLWSALEEGLRFKSVSYGDKHESNVDEMFILSDGAPSVGDVLDPIEMLRIVRESNRFANVRIHTIYISSEEPRGTRPPPWMSITPEEMMKRMAEQNGGKFVNL
jgi:Mg-chelatase subunit ChlD